MLRWLLVCLGLAACAAPRSPPTPTRDLDVEGFWALMEQVAAGECFSEDALYEEPPWKQFHSTERPMQMTWETESSLSFEEFSAATRF